MRIFVSIDIPKEIYSDIKKIQDKLPNFQGKLTEPENLHLTLKFLGEIDKESLEEVKEKLREIKFNQFNTNIRYIGFFDNLKYGLVWLYLDNFEELQKKIDETLKDFFKPEYRFMSHLTIARVKSVKDKKEFLESLKKIQIQLISFKVDFFRLKESNLTPNGSKYKTLEEYKLKI